MRSIAGRRTEVNRGIEVTHEEELEQALKEVMEVLLDTAHMLYQVTGCNPKKAREYVKPWQEMVDRLVQTQKQGN